MSNFMNTLLDMSLVGTYCILIVLVLRLLLRKAPRIFSYLLWGVVFLRLAFPIFPEAPVSLVPPAVRSNPVTSYFVADENQGLTDLVTTDISAGSAALPEAVKNSPELVQAIPANQDPASAPSNWIETVLSGLTSRNNISQAISVVWFGGIVLLASYNLIAYLRLRRRLTDAVLEDGVFVTDKISSPFVLGLLRPRIYLPVGLSPEERSYVILHEKSHLRRWDPVIKLLAFLITCLHWFNPFAWIAFLLFSRDIETACDESVVRNLSDSSRKSYSSTLLAVASGRNRLRPMPLAFGEGDLKGRIKSILNYKKPAIWLISLAVVAVVVTSIGLLMNPMSSSLFNEQTDDTESSTNSADVIASKSTTSSESGWVLPSTTTSSSESSSSQTSESTTPSESDWVLPSRWSDKLPNWTATTPVDPNEFESIFTKYNYKVTKVDATEEADAVYQAVSASGNSLITCTVYPNTDDSYRVLDEYLTGIYADYNPDSDAYSPLFGVYPDYFAAFNLSAYPNFRAVFLSGTVIFDVRFPLEMSEILPYMHAAQEFGFGEETLNFEVPMPDLPESMTLGTQEQLAEILSTENLTLEKSADVPETYIADSDDGSVRVIFSPFDSWGLRMQLLMLMYPPEQEASTYQLSYGETDSYRYFSWSSADQETYGIQVDQRGGWYLKVIVWWSEDPTTEAAQRAYADDLLKKLCFPDA